MDYPCHMGVGPVGKKKGRCGKVSRVQIADQGVDGVAPLRPDAYSDLTEGAPLWDVPMPPWDGVERV
jgi:hypothetical protein